MIYRPRLLFVEANSSARDLAQTLLGQAGFEVFCCRDAVAAARILQHHQIDLLLTDFSLPGLTGLELIAWIKKHAPRTPCLMMAEPEKQAEFEQDPALKGVTQILAKPFNFVDLIQQMKGMLSLGVSGHFKALNLAVMLQMLLLQGRSSRAFQITNKREKTHALVLLHDGEVQHASVYDSKSQALLLEGEAAFFYAMQIKNGLFSEQRFPADFSRNLHQPFQSLLMNVAKKQDEEQSDQALADAKSIRRIMVIDDDMLIRTLLKTHLRMQGFECIEMASALAAQEYLAAQSVDLIITDVYMPEMDGLAFIRWLHTQPHNCPVMIMTAVPGRDVEVFSESYDVWRYLKKPLKLDQLSGFLLELAQPECEGFLEHINTFELIQLFLSEGKPRYLQFKNQDDGTQAEVWFQNGRILHARADDLEGTDALMAIVAIKNGRFYEKEWLLPPATALAEIPPHRLLLQAARYLDAQNAYAGDAAQPTALDVYLQQLAQA